MFPNASKGISKDREGKEMEIDKYFLNASNKFFSSIEISSFLDHAVSSICLNSAKSFEILPLDGSSQITIETGILFRLKFMCYKENAMLDANMEVSTMDDMTVFQVGQVLGEVGQKDSKKGIYTVEFKIDPYRLNAGRYKTEIFFGENQRYIVYGGFEQCFEVENSLADMGFNQSVMPGFLRPKNDFKITFSDIAKKETDETGKEVILIKKERK